MTQSLGIRYSGLSSKEPIDFSHFRLGAITKKALNYVESALIIKGICCDTVARLIVSDENRPLFTANVENRLVALLRSHYKETVLLQIEPPSEDERRKRVLAKARERRAEWKKSKELEKLKTLTVNS